ncbi:TRAP transporter large permease [Devosia rhizoryzae]|uniref:TRAP transporter large permease protein n=1 Tax=Devosia rhizoryzae TaxID=2774137 RepID=A0ABX7C8Y6_9HYPH|nr:TRAP transporter large permease [Devosia rhizoryzae]QQR38426.1 TRAP transporter large permease [Devosia rhizoryzae]
MSLLYIVVLLLLLAAGIPVAASLMIVGIGGVLVAGVPVSIIGQRLAFGIDSFTLIAIPMFLLMGNLMNASGVTQRIFDFSVAMVGHWRAGLAQVNIIGSLIFSGMSGSALADAAGLGTVEIRAMTLKGYSPQFSAAITAASATIGPVIPPSTIAVLYAFIADVSIGRMFLAGVVPGLMMVFTLMVTVYWRGKSLDLPVHVKSTWAERGKATWKAFPALLVPIGLIGGMRTGIFTATEVAAVGVLYALFLAAIYYKDTKGNEMLAAFRETALSTGGIMLIVASANVFAWILAREQIPQDITAAVVEMNLSPIFLLLMVNLILLLLGMILDASAILILVTPVMVPALVAVGVDPVHFGMVMIVNMMVGMITPPVGMALYIVANIAKTPVMDVARECIPFIVGFLVILLVITLMPQLVLWLPDLVYGPSLL